MAEKTLLKIGGSQGFGTFEVKDTDGEVSVEHNGTQPRRAVQTLTADGAITIDSGLVLLSHASVAIDATLDAPEVGDELFIVNSSSGGTAAHNVTLPSGVTWDGSNDTATLNAPGEALHVIAISATRWLILENIGSVGLS